MNNMIDQNLVQKKVLTYRYYNVYVTSSDGVASITTKKSSWYNEHLKPKNKRKLEYSKYKFRDKIWKII